MNNQIAPVAPKGDIMESVIIKGDLSQLTPQERSMYYMKVCDSVGLNSLTQPFQYITLNHKLTLYATRTCTDQLRSIYGVSVEDLLESEREGVFIVTAKVRNSEGRTDVAKGAVNIAGLKGEALANAMMKAETKAKRRATLSLCGLGMLDETEIETIPAVSVDTTDPVTGEINKAAPFWKTATLRNQFTKDTQDKLNSAKSVNEVNEVIKQVKDNLDGMRAGDSRDELAVESIQNTYRLARTRFQVSEQNKGSAASANNGDFVPVEEGGLTPEELSTWEQERANLREILY